jgi:formylglycine-generating enzyme required for sulfatase activity
MVLVEAGSFEMGSAGGFSREQPVHTVNITRPFYVGRYEATLMQYDEFTDAKGQTGLDDSGWGRGNRPAGASWYDAVAYCNWLSERVGFTPCYSGEGIHTVCDFEADGYRLPTEAEWEYAARGGQRSQRYMYAGSNVYAGSNDPETVAWHVGNSGEQTYPVGQKQPNELGLYDMSGNVGEWCWDWYGRHYYDESPSNDPTGPDLPSGYANQSRVRRGGDFYNGVDSLRITARSLDWPITRRPEHGFRVVRLARDL